MGVTAAQLGVTGIVPNTTGLGKNLAQQIPTFILLETNDTLANVLVTGYLNASAKTFGIPYSNQQIALVYTTDSGSVWLQIAVTGTAPNYIYSLVGTTNVSTIFEASVGTAAAPSYTFVGRTNTGMYSPAANTIGFSAGGLLSFEVARTASSVNFIIASGGATNAGNAALQPGFVAAGTDTNVDVSATGKAAGGFAVLASTTGSAGHIKLWNGAANFYGEIVFVALGQTSVMTIADVGSAAGRFLVANTATPFVSGNFPKASGTGGLMVDSGFAASNIMLLNAVNTMAAASQIILDKGVGTESSNAVTINKMSGVITTTSLTTAGGATETITLTNSEVAANSVVLASIGNGGAGGNTATNAYTVTTTVTLHTVVFVITNLTAATALNGTLVINFAVF